MGGFGIFRICVTFLVNVMVIWFHGDLVLGHPGFGILNNLGSGFRIEGLGFRAWGVGFDLWVQRFGVWCLGLWV